MELKETITELKEILKLHGVGMTPFTLALQTAISHLETLQKVKEAGEVKRRVVQIGDSDNGFYPTKGQVCIHGINITRGDRLCIECANDRGFNQALDAVHAELMVKLEGVNGVIKNWGKSIVVDEGLIDDLALTIRELILGKKEE